MRAVVWGVAGRIVGVTVPWCGDIDAWAPEDLAGVAAVVGDGQLEFFHVVIGSLWIRLSVLGTIFRVVKVFAAVERLKVRGGRVPTALSGTRGP